MPELPPLPPVADQPISVVLLARDDAAHAEEVVEAWAARLDALSRDYEILVVDDGTVACVDAVAARRPQVRRLPRPERDGHGAALRAALAAATKPLFFYTTCDRQYDPADLTRLLAEIDKVHLISGFRNLLPMPEPLRLLGGAYRLLLRVVFGFAPEPLPAWLGAREYLFRLLIRAAFAVRVRDVNCAFRLFRRGAFDHLPLQSHGSFVHAEILAKANFLGLTMNDDVLIACRPRPREAEPWRKDFTRLLSHPTFEAAAPQEPVPSPGTAIS